MVWQVKDLHPHEMIYNVANELFHDEDINWGRIIALLTFVHVVIQTIHKSVHSYTHVLRMKKKIAVELFHYTNTYLHAWITANGGWVSFLD